MVRKRRASGRSQSKGRAGKSYGPWGALEMLWTPMRRPKKRKGFFSGGRKKRRNRTPVAWLLRWIVILAIWAVTIATLIVLYYAHDLPDISHLKETTKTPAIVMTAESAQSNEPVVLVNYGDLLGDYVHVEELPIYVTHAILATEDRRFYSHFGVDVWGLMRAAYVNYRAGRVVQGGSTITQQLAKNLFLTPDRTIKRKVQEMVLAIWLERHFTKDEILTIYLNRVYLGAGNYGIDAASRFYFGKPAQEVSLYEAAILAGLLKAPSRYSPTSNPKKAEQRANQVLAKMKRANFLQMYPSLKKDYTEVKVRNDGRGALKNPYFADWVLSRLPEYVGTVSEDMQIETTLDLRLQKIAEKTVNQYINAAGKEYQFSQAAVIGLSKTGEVLTMVGGKSYKQSQFNRAATAVRQPGSAFKLFVYLTAFQKGLSPDDTIIDEPFVAEDGYAPKNYNDEYQGLVTIEEAFAKSINTVAIKLAHTIGIDPIHRVARKLGVTSDLSHDLGIALGSNEITLLELAQAYAHIANGGSKIRVHAIKSIHDSSNTLLYQRYAKSQKQILRPEDIEKMQQVLSQVIISGTGKRAKTPYTLGGKTGTSQDYRDAWFIGYTDDIILAIWVGNDNNSAMKNVTGGSVPAKIWHDIVMSYYEV